MADQHKMHGVIPGSVTFATKKLFAYKIVEMLSHEQ